MNWFGTTDRRARRRTGRRVVAVVAAALAAAGAVAVGTAPAPASADPGDVVMIGAGDIATCRQQPDGSLAPGDGPQETAAILDANPDASVFTLGDTTYPDFKAIGAGTYDHTKAEEFSDCYDPTWGRAKDRTHPAIGNHEYEPVPNDPTPPTSSYFGYFGAAAGDPAKGYYSYDVGPYWHVVVLNSECDQVGGCGAGSPQEQWLRADLASTNRNVVALMHKPLYNTGAHRIFVGLRPLWRALYAYGADLVLDGHVHVYDRYAPINAWGKQDNAYGLRQFIVGTGGAGLSSGVTTWSPLSQAHSNNTWGVLRLTLHQSSYAWQFVPAGTGTFTDSGSQATHGRPPTYVGFARPRYDVQENAGTLSLTVTRKGNTDLPSTVNYSFSGSATQGSDYTATPGTLSFAPGETTKTIPVTVTDDIAPEKAESVRVNLSPADSTSTLAQRSTAVWIGASDQQPDNTISTTRVGHYVGKYRYNTSGYGQTRTVTARRTQTRTFYVRVFNNGNARNTFAVQGSRGAGIRYLSGGRDVTARMLGSAGLPVTLRPHDSRLVEVRMTVPRRARIGAVRQARVTTLWSGDRVVVDRVLARERVSRR